MFLQGLKLLLAPGAWRIVSAAARLPAFEPAAVASAGPFIFACLHRDILPAIIYVKPAAPALMVSDSADGDILVKTLGRRNYRYVRGATGSGGSRALVGLRRELEEGHSVGLAVDGPDGPYGRIQDGVFHLARATGAVILPLVARLDRPLVLKTWDRTVIPVPFRSAAIEVGPLLRAERHDPGADFAGLKRQMAAFFGVEEVNS